MNTTINGNNWLKLTLEGTESNRDVIGAKVTVHRTDGRTTYRAVKAGGSYQSSGTKSLFIGLEKTTIDQLLLIGLRDIAKCLLTFPSTPRCMW